MIFIKHLERIIANRFSISANYFRLFKLEAKLAGIALPSLVMNLSLLIPVTLTLWLTLMMLFGFLIYQATEQFLLSTTAVIVTNLIIAFVLLRNLKIHFKDISFSRTRDCLETPLIRKESEPSKERTVAIDTQIGRKD